MLLLLVFFLLFGTVLSVPDPASTAAAPADDGGAMKTYLIVVCRTDGPKQPGEQLREWHASLLAAVLNTTADELLHGARAGVEGQGRLVYSYAHVVSGFAARLTAREAGALSKLQWCVDALPDSNYRLSTTYTPRLLGMSAPPPPSAAAYSAAPTMAAAAGAGAWSAAGNMGEGIIVAVLDGGVDPRHVSFGDEGMPAQPLPAKWRGRCDFGGAPCNKKLIGGRSRTPVDHGTHTASTAVGAFVKDATVDKENVGTASGMAPRAHLAFYEVCFSENCSATEMLTAIERCAFKDGIDVLSISASDDTQKPLYLDLLAVGSFSAAMSGVFVSTSAGNDGPVGPTVTNCAPWQLTVAASTMGRRIVSEIKLGNGLTLHGEIKTRYKTVRKKPIVFVKGSFAGSALKSIDVRGKIVLCDRTENTMMRAEMIAEAGGVGMVSMANLHGPGMYSTLPNADDYAIPASLVNYADGEVIRAYISSTPNPTASLHYVGIVLNTSSPPKIAAYSSRGPCNLPNIGVLKPDITGPGTNIVAAFPGGGSSPHTSRAFGTMWGTSMAAPHLSGIAAVIKKARPGWSPAAIRSAMMTTADTTHADGTPIIDEWTNMAASHFAMGAGIVNPTKALNPGLIYDLSPEDYIPYVCGLGYNDNFVNEIIAQPMNNVTCAIVSKIDGKDLNYPSLMVTLTTSAPAVEAKRTVTNVGEAPAVYRAEVVAPKGVAVEVMPQRLEFASMLQRKFFTVRFWRGAGAVVSGTAEGSLRWVSDKHSVRSPLAIVLKQ